MLHAKLRSGSNTTPSTSTWSFSQAAGGVAEDGMKEEKQALAGAEFDVDMMGRLDQSFVGSRDEVTEARKGGLLVAVAAEDPGAAVDVKVVAVMPATVAEAAPVEPAKAPSELAFCRSAFLLCAAVNALAIGIFQNMAARLWNNFSTT